MTELEKATERQIMGSIWSLLPPEIYEKIAIEEMNLYGDSTLLRHQYLIDHYVGNEGLPTYNMHGLTYLNLTGNDVTDDALHKLPYLQTLILPNNTLLTNDGLALNDKLEKRLSLVYINLPLNVNIDNDGLRYTPNVEYLKLKGNRRITNLNHVRNLRELILEKFSYIRNEYINYNQVFIS